MDLKSWFSSYILKNHQLYKIKNLTEKVVPLDPIEVLILECLLSNHRRIVTYEEIEEEVWKKDEPWTTEESLRKRLHVHIRKIRTKVGRRLIRNFPKRGYQITAKVEASNDSWVFTNERSSTSRYYDPKDDYCDQSSLEQVCGLGNSALIRIAHIDEETLLRRYSINNKIIKCIRVNSRIRDDNTVVGYYILYPITKECEELITQGSILQGRQIEDHHICESFDQCSALYLSMVYAEDEYLGAYLLLLIEKDILQILNKNKNIEYIFTRPCTDQGVRAASRRSFSKLPENSQVHFRRSNSILS